MLTKNKHREIERAVLITVAEQIVKGLLCVFIILKREESKMVKRKKMLTVEDLYKFCLENNFAKFSAKESGYQLAVQVPTTFEIDDASDENHRGMMRLKFRILHDGKNRNGSFVSHKAAVKASNTIADRPIMAAIHQLDDGSWDFKSHEMEIVENEDGESEVNYIEKQVGSFSSEKPFWEHDDELDKDYLCAYGYIAEEYTKAADIIRNKGWTKNSCELVIEEMSFNAKEKQLELNEFYLSASTLLGREDDGTPIGEGMLGSRADIADFSVENNSLFSQNEKVIEMLSALNEKIDNLNIEKISKEGGNQNVVKEFEEKSEEEIKNSPSAEVFDGDNGDGGDPTGTENLDYYTDPDENGDGDNSGEGTVEPSDNGASLLGASDGENGDNGDGDGDGDDGDNTSDDESGIPLGQRDDDDTAGGSKKKYSIDYTVKVDGIQKNFSVSLKEKLNALTILVNDTYGEADGAWYDCDVIEETKTVEFHDWWANKHYRQSYSVKKDVYSLKGDRVETFVSFLTSDEKAQLEQMKSNYSSIESELASYKAEPEKQAVLAEECYAQIADTEAFKKLVEQDTHFSMSVDEVRAEADKQLLEYAKGHKIEYSAEESKKTVGVKKFANPSIKSTKGTGRYGGIFKK